jgi:hypothetical protein
VLLDDQQAGLDDPAPTVVEDPGAHRRHADEMLARAEAMAERAQEAARRAAESRARAEAALERAERDR